ncbi:MAG: RNase adapter RapZ [Nitrospirae bacterium]|nr:RNase adapter RapZ [Nitrospirota bacterium]
MNKRPDVKTGPAARGAPGPSRVLIITGLSGSGKTVALRAVEDLNFFCVDNLPVSLISSLVARISGPHAARDVAIGIDIREKEFLYGIDRTIKNLRKKLKMEIIFLDAETDVLIRRFKETRRPHPLGGDLEDAIKAERISLSALRQNADRIVDTSSLSPHQLRKLVSSFYQPAGGTSRISIALISFGFKYGVPQNVDLLFDVRFLPNPFFVPSLRELNGMDRRVSDYVFRQRETKEFMTKVNDLLAFLVPLYKKEGRSYLSVGFGCTGGNHRSPAIVERIAKRLRKPGVELTITHRDIS